jgi:hypothetical protein
VHRECCKRALLIANQLVIAALGAASIVSVLMLAL